MKQQNEGNHRKARFKYDASVTPEENLFNVVFEGKGYTAPCDIAEATQKALSFLEPRERAVISGLFGIAGTRQSLTMTSAVMGVSTLRVAQIRDKAISKLRQALPSMYLHYGATCENPLSVCKGAELAALDIGYLGLTRRELTALYRAEITSIGNLVDKTPSDLSKVYRIGVDSIVRIEKKLLNYGLSLKGV